MSDDHQYQSLSSRSHALVRFPFVPRVPLQVQWVLCVQESVLDGVLARLRLRLAGLKCVSLAGEADRALVEAVVQGAQQQGATVSRLTARSCQRSKTLG